MSLLAKNSVAMNKFPLLCRQVAKIQTLQCSCSGRPTGNGKKLSSSQAQLGRQHAWLLLNSLPFPVGQTIYAHCKPMKANAKGNKTLTQDHSESLGEYYRT